MTKRVFDVLVASFLIWLLTPAMLAAAIAIKIEGRMSVFWYSPRVGRNGKPFKMICFHTMVESTDGPGVERLTPVGRFIRNYSINEFPPLFNVLRGEMSVIGPRPMEPVRVDLTDPTWQRILAVRPGCASYAIFKLAKGYNASRMEDKQRLELEYLEKVSVRLDATLVVKTIQSTLSSRGNHKMRGKANNLSTQ